MFYSSKQFTTDSQQRLAMALALGQHPPQQIMKRRKARMLMSFVGGYIVAHAINFILKLNWVTQLLS